MNSREIMEMIFKDMDDKGNYTHSVDTFKSGDAEKQVKKLAVGMFPSYKLIKEAAQWGADLLIVHEPVYYNHYDDTSKLKEAQNPAYIAKSKLIEESGMAICRLHDHMHHANLDRIALGEMELLGLAYTHTANPYYAVNRFELEYRERNIKFCCPEIFSISGFHFESGYLPVVIEGLRNRQKTLCPEEFLFQRVKDKLIEYFLPLSG